MSQVLSGLIQSALKSADPIGSANPIVSAGQIAFANAVAVAVQTYLTTNVTVSPGQTVNTQGSAAAQVGTTTGPGKLLAP